VSLTPLTVPFDIMVVDPDLLWRVDAMNAFDHVMVKDMVTVLGATDELTPGHPAVVLLGPAASVESDDQLPVLRSMFPEVRVVSVGDARLATAPAPTSGPGDPADPIADPGADPAVGPSPAAGADRPGPRLSLVPDPPADHQADHQVDQGGAPGHPAAGPAPYVPLAAMPDSDMPDSDMPDSDMPDSPSAPDDRAATLAPAAPAPWFDRTLPANTPMDTIVAVTLEELAVARDDADASSGRAATRPRLVLVTGAKAGEGASTLALNLAAAATRGGAKVVLVEADPLLGDLTLMLGLPANADAMLTHPGTGMRVLVLPPAADPFELIDARVLTEALAALQTGRARGGPIDLIVLDAPATVVRRTGVAGLADRVLVTCSARLQNVKNARILIDELGVIASEVVLNRTGRHGLAETKIEALLGAPIIAEIPNTHDLEPARFDTVPGILGERTDYARAIGPMVAGIVARQASTGGRPPPPPPRFIPSTPLPATELPRPPGAPQG